VSMCYRLVTQLKNFKVILCATDLNKLILVMVVCLRLEAVFNTAPAVSKNNTHIKSGPK